jgi:N utilization substance protein A
LIQAALFPARVKSIEVLERDGGEKVVVVEVPTEQKGLAIGRGGRTIKRARLLAKRYYGADVVLK